MKQKLFFLGIAGFFILSSFNAFGIKGPRITFPSKGQVIYLVDPVFTWKYSPKASLSFEVMLATDPNFEKNVIVLKTTQPYLHLTLPYLKRGRFYFWSVRAIYKENNIKVITNWCHLDKKNINIFKFQVSDHSTGYTGFEPLTLSPGNDKNINTLKPEFSWGFPDHKNAIFQIKNIHGQFVSPEFQNIKYLLRIARSVDLTKDKKDFLVKSARNLKLTIPYLSPGSDFYWGVKAIYLDPVTGKTKETTWSRIDTLTKAVSHFHTSKEAIGVFGFETGMKEEVFDPYKIKSVEKLTADMGNSFSPAVSMDGRKLAFCSDRLGHLEIFVKNLDEKIGSGATQKTTSPRDKMNFNPFWLNDDAEVAFYSNRYKPDIWHLFTSNRGTGVTIQTLGMEMKEDPSHFNLYGSCSTDGKMVYTVKLEEKGMYYLYLLDPEDESKTQLKPGMFPDIRNENKIVYCSNETGNYEIIIVDLEGRSVYRPTFLTSDPALDYDPAFSPDGTRIAFTSTRSGNSDIWVMNIDGTNPTQVTFHPLVDRRPQWIDNETIVFQSNRTIGKNGEPIYNIYKMIIGR